MSTPITTSFAEIITRASFLRDVLFKSAETDPIYKQMVDVVGKDYSKLLDGVETASMSGMGPIKKKGETTPFEYDAPGPGQIKRSYYEEYGLAAYFTPAFVRRAQFGMVEKIVKSLGWGYDLARNLQVGGLYDDAFTGSLYTGPDGLPLISTAHTYPGSGVTRSNRLAVDSPLSYTSAQAAMTLMKRQTNPRGYPAPALKSGQTILVIIPPEMEFEAYKIFNREAGLDPTTNTNSINVLRNGNISYKIIVNPYLSSTGNWFFVNPDEKGIKLVDEVPLKPDMFYDPFQKGLQHDVYASWVLHPEDWEFMYGSKS